MSLGFFVWKLGAILSVWRYAGELDQMDVVWLRLTFGGRELSGRVSRLPLLGGPVTFVWEARARVGARSWWWRSPKYRATDELF